MNAFTPTGATVAVSATTVTSNAALSAGNTTNGFDLRVHNAGSALAFVAFGASSAITATTASMPVPAGAVEVFSCGSQITHMAAITASGTATVYATPGQGI